MTRWELTSFKLLIPITVFVQMVLGAGFAVGMGLLFGDDVPQQTALYLATGVPTVTLITIGLVLGPQLVGQARLANTYDFLWSLPIPRSAAAAAWLTVTAIISIPGMIVAVVVAAARDELTLSVSPGIVPAVLLTLTTGTLVGYALAHAIPDPTITVFVTQVLVFVILGFSPVNLPPEQLPGWLAAIHQGLPLSPMANVIRGSLTEGIVTNMGLSYLLLSVWTLAAAALAGWALRRRG